MKIEILGNPIPLQRARAFRNRFYDPQMQAKKNFALEVKEKLKEQNYEVKFYEGPIELNLFFLFEMPKSWSNKKKERMNNTPHQGHVDIDNLQKFNFDALQEILWADDSQIWRIQAEKIWSFQGKTILEIAE